MANPSTTHVIEIETGIGEPAFIPLTLGQELQPISVGKKGMWRIESPQVRDVHAFVYFDGSSLFLQSADESAAATVDGYKVGKAWTELHAPCKIDIGSARLRYRSLLPDNDSAMTVVKAAPPVQGVPGGAASLGPPLARAPGRGGSGQRPAVSAPLPAAGAPPPAAGSAPSVQPPPASFPKADRPFRPGEFSSGGDDESTRFAPVDVSNARTGASVSLARPAAGQPADGQAPVRSIGPGTGMGPAVMPAGQSGAYAPIGAGPMQGAMQGSMPPPMGGSMQPPMGAPMPGMMQGAIPPGYPGPGMPGQMSYPPPGGFAQGAGGAQASGAYGAMASGMNPMMPSSPQAGGPSMPPGGFGSMTPQGGMQQPAPQGGDLLAKYNAMSVPKRIIVVLLPIAMLAAVASMWSDDTPPAKPKIAHADAGAPGADGGLASRTVPPAGGGVVPSAGGGAVPPAGVGQVPPAGGSGAAVSNWPPGVPCPPPGWPADRPPPCTPNSVSSATAGTNDSKDSKDSKDSTDAKDSKDSKDSNDSKGTKDKPSNAKTLERQAVDAVAAGDRAKAAALYEELSRRDPNNRVYAEAARILRAKLDAGP